MQKHLLETVLRMKPILSDKKQTPIPCNLKTVGKCSNVHKLTPRNAMSTKNFANIINVMFKINLNDDILGIKVVAAPKAPVRIDDIKVAFFLPKRLQMKYATNLLGIPANEENAKAWYISPPKLDDSKIMV